MSTRIVLMFSFLDRYSGLIITVASSMILARLLTPAEIGVYSVTVIFLGFLSAFRDLGAGQYLVQEKELTQDRIRATWTVQLGLGLLLAFIVFTLSIPVANFYHDPRIESIMWILALNFTISPFGSLTHAWLTREMRFGAIAIARFIGNIFGASVSIILAWQSFGPISLAWGSLTTTVLGVGSLAVFRPSFFPWLPGLKDIRRVVSFGWKVTVASLLETLRNGIPELFLGRFQGMLETGYYSRAQGLVSMFNRLIIDAVMSVALPLFAKKSRSGEELASSFIYSTALITALGWSFLGCLAVLALPLMRLLYGSQWDDAVDITRWLCLAMSFTLCASLCRSLLLASGNVNLVLRLSATSAAFQVVCVALGAYNGMKSLGWALCVSAVISAAMWLIKSRYIIGFKWLFLFRTFGLSLAVALATVIIPLSVMVKFNQEPIPVLLILGIAVPSAVVGFFGMVYVVKHALIDEIRILISIPTLRRKTC